MFNYCGADHFSPRLVVVQIFTFSKHFFALRRGDLRGQKKHRRKLPPISFFDASNAFSCSQKMIDSRPQLPQDMYTHKTFMVIDISCCCCFADSNGTLAELRPEVRPTCTYCDCCAKLLNCC